MSTSSENPQTRVPVPDSVSGSGNIVSVKESTLGLARPGAVTSGDARSSSSMNEAAHPAENSSWFKRSCKAAVTLPTNNNYEEHSEADPTGTRGLHLQRSGIRLFAVFINNDNLWNSTPQILKYWFLHGGAAGNDVQKQKVRDAIDEWTWYANVEFQEAVTAEESNIRIEFDPDDGSWSYFGRQCEKVAPTDATMNLGWLDKYTPSMTVNERAVILHQFGHVLGLLHEHQSPAHGGIAVSNIEAAIALFTSSQGWSVQQVYDRVISVYATSDVSNFSQVDINSIMHYPQPKEITGLAEDIPYNTKLSDLDKAYVILQYPRKEMHPKAKSDGWSFEKALDVMGAPDNVKVQVLHLLQSDRDSSTGEISPSNTRSVIKDWTRSAHSLSETINSRPAPIDQPL